MLKLLIVEDFMLTLKALEHIFKRDNAFSMVHIAETAEDALEQFKQDRPDIVVTDLGLPGISGIELTQQIRQLDPEIKVVILTSHETEEEVLQAFSSGANAYCLKSIKPDKLLEVVKDVAEGAAWMDPVIARVGLNIFQRMAPEQLLRTGLSERHGDDIYALTDRDMTILKLLADGKTNMEIGQELYVSTHTVKVYVSRLLEKLAVSDRTQAAVKAVKEGII